jgi:hypothetical protein
MRGSAFLVQLVRFSSSDACLYTNECIVQHAAVKSKRQFALTVFVREYYERLVARGMNPATAKGHMAGKLAVVLYGMLKTMTPYDEQKHRKALGLPEPAQEVASTPVQASVEALDDEQDLLGEIDL